MILVDPFTRQVLNTDVPNPKGCNQHTGPNCKRSSKDTAIGAGLVGSGAILGGASVPVGNPLTKAYHVTPKENVESILREGLKASEGGGKKGFAWAEQGHMQKDFKRGRKGLDPNLDYVKHSKGKVHLTRSPHTRGWYKTAYKRLDPKELKVVLPKHVLKGMEADPTMGLGNYRTLEDIVPERIVGSKSAVRSKISRRVKDVLSGMRNQKGKTALATALLGGGTVLGIEGLKRLRKKQP